MKYPNKKEALKLLFDLWSPVIEYETVSIEESLNRITAVDLFSKYTLPVYRASSADGIATSSDFFKDGFPDTSNWKEGIEYERADTGDDFEDKYDFVIRIEDVSFSPSGSISISENISSKAGTNVSKKGKIVSEGELLIEKGVRLRPHHLATIAMGGHEYIEVRKKPKVAFIPTGSELIPRGSIPKRGLNIDSNSIMIKNMLIEMGAEAIMFPIIKDMSEDLESVLNEAIRISDIVVINAGSSKGKEDLNTKLIEQKGTLLQHRIATAPGFPLGIGIIDDKPVVNLPGPNIAAFYGADWCVRAIVSRALDIPVEAKPIVKAVLQETLNAPEKMDFLCKIVLEKDLDEKYTAYPKLHKKYSGAASSSADAFYISPIGTSVSKAGEIIEVELINNVEYIKLKI